MNKAWIISIVLLFSSINYAQEFAVGLKGGFHTLSIGEINSRGSSLSGNPPDVVFQPNSDVGFQLGGYLSVEFGKLFIRPEINYFSSKNLMNLWLLPW